MDLVQHNEKTSRSDAIQGWRIAGQSLMSDNIRQAWAESRLGQELFRAANVMGNEALA